jgi:phage terminase small subunit
MPLKNGRHTPMEMKFIEAMSDEHNPVAAAKKAGYSSPDKRGYDLMSRPSVQSEVAERQLTRINTELLPNAVDILNRLLTDVRVPAGAAFNAAKFVIDRALPMATEGQTKNPHEMTGDELSRQLDRLRHEAAARSGKIIDAEIVNPPSESPSVFE